MIPALNRNLRPCVRRFGRMGVAAVVALFLAAALTGCAGGDQRPPNFVIIVADDLGYADLGCYWTPGDLTAPRIDTPNIDRMAREGIRFTDFYSAASTCSPARAAFLTGCYPQRVGFAEIGTVERWICGPQSRKGLNPSEITIAELLQKKGYRSACIGKWHLGHQPPFLPRRQGFTYYFGPLFRSKKLIDARVLKNERFFERIKHSELTERYTQEAIAFIRRNRKRPFFLYLSHSMPHVPLGVTAPFQGRSHRGLYGDTVMELDASTGRILRVLKQLGLDQQTLVVFTSDNGPALKLGELGGSAHPLRSGKGWIFEGGFRVPCVMTWPGRIPEGVTCSEVTTMMDFLPTMARLAGVEVPTDRIIDGKDIWPLMTGEPGAKSPYEAFFYYHRERLAAVRSGDWKLIDLKSDKVTDPTVMPVPVALYNLRLDPGEERDRLTEFPDTLSRLMDLMAGMREDLGDGYSGMTGANRRPPGVVAEGQLRTRHVEGDEEGE